MREIKFRAYDRLLRKWKTIEETAKCVEYAIMYDTPGDIELLQYTGLKDKNGTGVEAYESDLAQRRDGKRGEIIWHQESCGFAIAFGDDEPLGSLSSWFEVVGNKYEQ